jgi:3-hydroxybutyryl-CoA dehydrogenase
MQQPSKRICICGAGTMGAGIAQVASQAGYVTILYDTNQQALEKARSGVEKNLSTLFEKNRISADQQKSTLNNILFTRQLSDCRAELIIEAILEDLSAKTTLFKQLAAINSNETIFATNTSSLSVSAIAAALPNPERVAGLHFFNPPTLMKLVEVVQGSETKVEVMEVLTAVVKTFGKLPVVCNDFPGFIVNRVARPYYLEALKLAEEGIDIETIDQVMEATGFKMGPFKLMDLIGNDINKPVRFQPSPIQQEKVKSGELGRKTGKGYYKY